MTAACPTPSRRRTCSTCTASARRRSRSRRSGWRPGWPSTGPTCTGGARSCRRRRARRWRWSRRHRRLAGRPLGRHRQLARRLLRHRGGRATGWPAVLLNPAVDPARDLAAHIGEQTAFHDPRRALLLRAGYVDELRALHAAAARRTRALLRRHRQGRRGARLARDARALRRLPRCGCSTAATTRCRDFDDHLPHHPGDS